MGVETDRRASFRTLEMYVVTDRKDERIKEGKVRRKSRHITETDCC